MCGFTGIINFDRANNVDANLLKRMTDTIHHRGPDDEGYFIRGNIGLGFRRLSIIDLKNGHQPMSDTDGKYWIVFNGEIYNYRELRKDLISIGHRFATDSDTEVIIAMYKEYGADCVSRLRGMFAFVIWDSTLNRMFMARDQFGIKPFYYKLCKTGIVFASEMKAITKNKLSDNVVDTDAIDSYFSYGYVLAPYTIYIDVKKLQAGHYMEIDVIKGSIALHKRYWQPTFCVDKSISYEDYMHEIRESLLDSVKKHLVSDVPVGAFLSGGIDSSSVVSMMASVYNAPLHTFTIGFEEEAYNEAVIAANTSQYFNTIHHQLIITKKSALDLKAIIDLYDEPFADSSAIPTYYVSELASEHVKVVLSGDGGDELFGGYGSYQRLARLRNYNIPEWFRKSCLPLISGIWPSKLPGKRFSYMLSHDTDTVYAHYHMVNSQEKKKLYNNDLYKSVKHSAATRLKSTYITNSKTEDYLSRMMELDIHTYLPDDILTKVDIASMANSIEVRVPILDTEVFNVAARIPSEFKVRNSGKVIFKDAMSALLPNELKSLPKKGFTIPINQWFKSDFDEFVKDSLCNDTITKQYFKQSYIDRLKDTMNLGSMVSRIWPLLVFYNWQNSSQVEN